MLVCRSHIETYRSNRLLLFHGDLMSGELINKNCLRFLHVLADVWIEGFMHFSVNVHIFFCDNVVFLHGWKYTLCKIWQWKIKYLQIIDIHLHISCTLHIIMFSMRTCNSKKYEPIFFQYCSKQAFVLRLTFVNMWNNLPSFTIHRNNNIFC